MGEGETASRVIYQPISFVINVKIATLGKQMKVSVVRFRYSYCCHQLMLCI